MARKHVTPANAAASVPDPIHGGYLPAAGIDVEYTIYWVLLALRGDIFVSDPVDPTPGDPAPGPTIVDGDQLVTRRGGIHVLTPTADVLAAARQDAFVLALLFG